MMVEGNEARRNWRLIYLLALAAGLAVANIYYNQPVLGLIGSELHSGDHEGIDRSRLAGEKDTPVSQGGGRLALHASLAKRRAANG